ncbi:hypothetical protein CK203_076472 [Vitis vinifera]|uniref:VTT domain-containing protein n=1 Tax=Vitis vinifera TaxID=29760 RepID=A0A438DAX5_VITVI|nr:hypothetical protein CK203_076472 [Vitis vinifera]
MDEEPMPDFGPHGRLVEDGPHDGGPECTKILCLQNLPVPDTPAGGPISLLTFVALLLFLVIKWSALISFSKNVNPLIKWLAVHFSPLELVAAIFASLALFPAALLESAPSLWIAGIVFGYELGFLIIIPGIAVGVTLPYFIAYPLRSKIQRLWFRIPKDASIVKLAFQGNWFRQFCTVVFIRTSPFPYRMFNYIASATNIKYSAYLVGSLVGVVPDIFAAIYRWGKDQHPISLLQIIIDSIGFCSSYTAMLIIGRQIKRLEDGEVKQLKEAEVQQAEAQREEDPAQ